MLYFKGLILLVFAALSIATASIVDPATLVIYDSKISDLDTYKTLLDSLKSTNLEITIKEASELIKLYKNDLKLYQNVVILPSKLRTLGQGEITGGSLLEFFNDGGDVFTVTSPNGVSEAVRSFLNQLGIYPSPRNHELIDHFNHVGEDHGLVKLNSTNVVDNGSIISSINDDEFSYKGSSAILGNGRLIFPLLQAPTTSFTKDSKNDDFLLENNWSVGTQGYLSVAFQGLNNARAFWIGSDSFMQDSSNVKFIEEVTSWTFQERKVIKSTGVVHSHVDGTSYDDLPYKIKDEISYKIGITEWNGEEWVPFIADDVQLEIKLLDPYHRLTLKQLGIEGTSMIYGINFTLPDHHGVFTFHLNYRRNGLSFIDETNTMAIRHLANDEYPRSWDITNSWVYLTSAIMVFIGWFIFVVVYLYSGEELKDGKKEK